MKVSRLLLLTAVLTTTACSAPARRPIQELFREALAASRIKDDPAEAEARRAVTLRGADPLGLSCPEFDALVVPPREGSRGPPVSDVFLDTDIREALQSLASQAGMRLAADEGVRGPVSGVFEGVAFEDALADLLAPHGWVFEKVGERYLVGTIDPTSPLFPLLARTWTYSPRHLTTQELLDVLPKFAAPYMGVNAARNHMTVTAPRDLGRRILGELERADQPVPQVVLEVIICELSPQSALELGFDLEGGFAGPDGEHTNLGIKNLGLSGAHGPPALDGLMSFQFASAYVRALATEGYVEIRAAPRVMVRDGEPASIAIGAETYFTVSTERFVFQQLQTVRSGITLELTPRIGDDMVTIKIDRAEVSDELRPSQLVSGDDSRLPTLNTRRVSTTVSVRDGQTIVIGGLVRRRQVERVVSVPILGQIPILGLLFQKSETRDEETEIAIFLSPRIVRTR